MIDYEFGMSIDLHTLSKGHLKLAKDDS